MSTSVAASLRLGALLVAALLAQVGLQRVFGTLRPDVLLVVIVGLAAHRRLRRPAALALGAGLALDLLGAGAFGVAALGYLVGLRLAVPLARVLPARAAWSALPVIAAAALALHVIEGLRTGVCGWSALPATLALGWLLMPALAAPGLVGEPPLDFARYRTA